jgi:sugar phosphate isomerase/epimerase
MNAHPRVSVSAISTFALPLDEDLAFWDRHGIERVGVSVAKMAAFGWDAALDLVLGAVDRGLVVANLIGVGAFRLDDPAQWDAQRARLERAIAAAERMRAGCLVFTTGPAGALSWEHAADALERALGPVLAHAAAAGVTFALEHTHSLRTDVGFVHTLRDVADLAARLDTGVCMEVNACWAERDLAGTIASAIERIVLVQVSDYAIGTTSTPDRLVPGDGDIPLARILRTVLDAGYLGAFDLELIGPRIDAEGYDVAVPRAVQRLGALLDELMVPRAS